MTLRRTVAAPFRSRGTTALNESEFVVELSLDREWFSADQAKRLVDVATSEGLLERTDDGLTATFEPFDVEVPPEFEPSEALLQRRNTFERILDRIVDGGTEKQTAVADINRLQGDLAISIDAAAALYGHRNGTDLTDLARRAREDL